jgi:short-subunit dehydrogenase
MQNIEVGERGPAETRTVTAAATRAAFVTGASSGLGRAIALSLARRGHRVFAGVRTAEDAAAVVAAASAGAGAASITPILLDVADRAQISAAARLVDDACGEAGLAVLVNAAGFATYAPLEYADEAEAARLFDVVAFAPHRLTTALLPALRRAATAAAHGRRRARVLTVVSWAALDASPFVGFYAAAKAACLRLGQAQAFELASSGIDVTSIVPGVMRTRFTARGEAALTAAIARLPDAGRARYGAAMSHMAKLAAGTPTSRMVPEPETIARKIVAIIERRRRPRHQHLIGVDTHLVVAIARWLPFWLERALKTAIYKLGAKPAAA